MKTMASIMQETAIQKATQDHADVEHLRGYILTCEPPHLTKLAEKLAAKRLERANAQAALDIMQAGHNAQFPERHMGPSAAMQRQAQVVAKLDAEVQALRKELEGQRASWAPTFFRGLKQVTEPAIPKVERAIADLEAALVLFSIGDDAVRDFGFSDWYTRRDTKLGSLIAQLERFHKFAAGKMK